MLSTVLSVLKLNSRELTHIETGERKDLFVGPFPGCVADSLVHSGRIQLLNLILFPQPLCEEVSSFNTGYFENILQLEQLAQ